MVRQHKASWDKMHHPISGPRRREKRKIRQDRPRSQDSMDLAWNSMGLGQIWPHHGNPCSERKILARISKIRADFRANRPRARVCADAPADPYAAAHRGPP